MTKFFSVPFAETGDKISPPNPTQADGTVSYAQGFGFDYQRKTDGSDPLAKVFPREQFNGIVNDITGAVGEIQLNGFPAWQDLTPKTPYPANAVVRHGGKNWVSLVSNNTATPAEGPAWAEATTNTYSKNQIDEKLSFKADKATTLAGYGIINAYTTLQTDNAISSGLGRFGIGSPSVSTLSDLNSYTTGGFFITPATGVTNLPEGWAQGHHVIDVGGGTTACSQVISGVSSNIGRRAYRSFSSAWSAWVEIAEIDSPAFTGQPTTTHPTLENNSTRIPTTAWAVLKIAEVKVSPAFTGVPTAPTAPLTNSSTQLATTAFVKGITLGATQSWQNVLASRAWNTNYTNSTPSPIAVSVVSQDGGGNLDLRIVVNGIVVSRCFFGAGVSACAFAVVPPGATYQAQRQDTNDTLIHWSELRA